MHLCTVSHLIFDLSDKPHELRPTLRHQSFGNGTILHYFLQSNYNQSPSLFLFRGRHLYFAPPWRRKFGYTILVKGPTMI